MIATSMEALIQQAQPYLMGQSEHERQRLQWQGGVLGPLTERFLRGAGIAPGMHVLDVGCGVGDVSLLCAELIGPTGRVVGLDRDPAALDVARERARTAGMDHVTFVAGDAQAPPVDGPFDAVVGRLILMYLPDPDAALRILSSRLRPAGIVAFHEADFTLARSLPVAPLFDQAVEWFRQTAMHSGAEIQMGLKLPQVYRAAGLPFPRLFPAQLVGGGPDFIGYPWVAGVIRSILPLMERFGVAAAEQVNVETLAERLRDDAVARESCITSPLFLGAAALRI